MGNDGRNDWRKGPRLMLHYIALLVLAYLVVLVMIPQHVLAVTFIAFAWLSSLDIWGIVPWTP